LQIPDSVCVNSVTYYGNYVTLYSPGIISFVLKVSNLNYAIGNKSKWRGLLSGRSLTGCATITQ